MNKIDFSDYHSLLTGAFEPESHPDYVPDYTFNPMQRSGELTKPLIDMKWVSDGGKKPAWPGGKEFAVCLTHDVDAVSIRDAVQNFKSIGNMLGNLRAFPFSFVARKIPARTIHSIMGWIRGKDDLCQFEKWMEFEDSLGARSTFFFAPGKVGKAHITDCIYTLDQKVHFQGKSQVIADMLRIMSKGGWEIGLHPSWRSHDDILELTDQKAQLEIALGHPVASVRQHYLKYDVKKTHVAQDKAGFKYDSTMGYNNYVGFRRGTSYPFQLTDGGSGKRLDLLEIPLSIQDGALIFPKKGMQLDVNSALDYIKSITKEVQGTGGVLNLLWHPNRYQEMAFWQLYQLTLNYLRELDPWFTTVKEIGDHWTGMGIDLLDYTQSLESQ
ncbi:MAG: polysaccharide deacetylase family protein [Candidatus Marinimicrobia bacterium]|nr:polysaccharide deacetylase family protein [Candidatus Neomarinimicrobiota bacterium]